MDSVHDAKMVHRCPTAEYIHLSLHNQLQSDFLTLSVKDRVILRSSPCTALVEHLDREKELRADEANAKRRIKETELKLATCTLASRQRRQEELRAQQVELRRIEAAISALPQYV